MAIAGAWTSLSMMAFAFQSDIYFLGLPVCFPPQLFAKNKKEGTQGARLCSALPSAIFGKAPPLLKSTQNPAFFSGVSFLTLFFDERVPSSQEPTGETTLFS